MDYEKEYYSAKNHTTMMFVLLIFMSFIWCATLSNSNNLKFVLIITVLYVVNIIFLYRSFSAPKKIIEKTKYYKMGVDYVNNNITIDNIDKWKNEYINFNKLDYESEFYSINEFINDNENEFIAKCFKQGILNQLTEFTEKNKNEMKKNKNENLEIEINKLV